MKGKVCVCGGYGSSAAMSSAARCPLHGVCSRCISAFRSTRRVWCTLCVTRAARFPLLGFRCPLPSCMVPAARRLRHVACGTSRVFGLLSDAPMCQPAHDRSAPRAAMRLACPVGCVLQLKSPRCRLSAARRLLGRSPRTHARACRTRCRYGAGGGGQEEGRGPFRAAHHLPHACHCHRRHLHGQICWPSACGRLHEYLFYDVCCTLSAARCPLHVAECMFSAARCPLHVVRCTLSAASYLFYVSAARFPFHVVCCMLSAARASPHQVMRRHVAVVLAVLCVSSAAPLSQSCCLPSRCRARRLLRAVACVAFVRIAFCSRCRKQSPLRRAMRFAVGRGGTHAHANARTHAARMPRCLPVLRRTRR